MVKVVRTSYKVINLVNVILKDKVLNIVSYALKVIREKTKRSWLAEMDVVIQGIPEIENNLIEEGMNKLVGCDRTDYDIVHRGYLWI